MYDKCFYKTVCDRECTYECGCNDCLHMQRLLDESDIPKSMQHPHKMKPQDCDLKAFEKLYDIAANIVNFVNSGKNIYLCSANTGNGKTTWAIRMLLNYLDWGKDYYSDNKFGAFVNVSEFLFRAKSEISNPTYTFNNYLRTLFDCKLLVLDDLCVQASSNYDMSLLYPLINHRELYKLSTIYTTNVLPKDLCKYIDVRIADRVLSNSGYIIELKGGSER